jgi:hypothetical protein
MLRFAKEKNGGYLIIKILALKPSLKRQRIEVPVKIFDQPLMYGSQFQFQKGLSLLHNHVRSSSPLFLQSGTPLHILFNPIH